MKMVSRTQFDAVIFDFFGVICSEVAPFWLRKYFDEERANLIKSTVIHAADSGEITETEMFSKLAQLSGVSVAQVKDEWWSYVQIESDVVSFARALRGKYKIGLLTNSPSEFVRDILNRYALLSDFDAIVVSSEEGAVKPEAAIYKMILEILNVEAERTLFIDDNPSNVAGANAVGIKGLLFTSCAELRGTHF